MAALCACSAGTSVPLPLEPKWLRKRCAMDSMDSHLWATVGKIAAPEPWLEQRPVASSCHAENALRSAVLVHFEVRENPIPTNMVLAHVRAGKQGVDGVGTALVRR